jgi:2-amino-1-hydroxyethylphosphonate dioxygenase (glycine-forming)
MPCSPAAASSASAILDVYARYGKSDYIGEKVSSVEHAEQAAQCGRNAGASDAVVVAALLHDVGHLLGLAEPDKFERMGECGVMRHESVGAEFLERHGLPAYPVASLVRRHVDAKRYLTFFHPPYYNSLSDASKTTLGYQGGPMSAEEAAAFEADPLKATILSMRKWDEAAKVPGLDVPRIESYRAVIEALIDAELKRRGTEEDGGKEGETAAV